jgi:hypothetical protein
VPVTYASEQKTIAFNSDQHRALLTRLRGIVQRGQDAVNQQRAAQWAKNEEQFLAYMPAKVNDELRKTARKEGEPQFTTIEIPYSYAILLTAHTYITSTFLARQPVLQIQGRHGEAQNAEMAIESLLDYQVNTGGHMVPYYIWTLDALKYGQGVIGYFWDEETITVRKRQKVLRTFMGMSIPGTEHTVETEEEVKGYVGNRAYNVRPQDFFTDPSFPVSQFQKGEFCGRYVSLSWLDLVDGEAEGCYFNIDQLKGMRRHEPNLRIGGSPQVTLPNNSTASGVYEDFITGNIDAYELYVRLVPYDWGLGRSRKSEKWVFVLAENNVIISAHPLGYYHNRFPFEVLESEIDGHSLFSRSLLEVMKPMNDTLTWLLNTHFYNVRKALNDQYVVDPSKVVMKDLTNPNPGRLIRLKPAAYGSDARLAVQQLQTQDITRANIQDAQLVTEMLQRITGINDNLMGMMNTGRKTATEVRSSTTFGINRMKTTTEYMSSMGFSPWTQGLVQTTQQMFDDDREYKIVGDAAQWAGRFLRVTPDDIAGFYDFVPVDGTLPIDRFAQVNLWQQLMGQMAKIPQVMGGYDFAKIFAFVAQLAGLKNISQFRVQVVPDATMQNQVQAGNSVPATADPGNVVPIGVNGGNKEPGQLPGMGQTL